MLISKVRKRLGRGAISQEVRDLIFQMVTENPSWGAPRIHGELLMLGFDVSERTISRWMKRVPRDPQPAQRWRAFLANHSFAFSKWQIANLVNPFLVLGSEPQQHEIL